MESSPAEWILLGTRVGGADYGLHFSVHLLVILTQLIQFKGMHSMSMTLLARAVDLDFFFADPDPAVFLNSNLDPAVFFNADPDPA